MVRPKWWLSVFYLVVVLYIMCIFQIYADSRQKYKDDGETYKSSSVISDVVHDHLVYTEGTWVCDLLVYPCLFFTILRILLTRDTRKRTKRLSKFLTVLATLYLIRCLTIIATIMPKPDSSCETDPQLFENWFYGALLVMAGRSKTCTDEVFSGHTINVLTCLAVWVIYHDNIVVYIVATIYGLTTLSIITITRYHYTIDVIVGFIVTFFLHIVCYRREIHAKFRKCRQVSSHGRR